MYIISSKDGTVVLDENLHKINNCTGYTLTHSAYENVTLTLQLELQIHDIHMEYVDDINEWIDMKKLEQL